MTTQQLCLNTFRPLIFNYTKKRLPSKEAPKKCQGKKVLPEFDVFPTIRRPCAKQTWIGKKQSRRSIKWGCQCCFFAKQPYKALGVGHLIYQQSQHIDKQGVVVHGVTKANFKDSLGSSILACMK